MSLELGLVLVCGLVALLYGAYLVRELLALSPGTKEMQEIAAAIATPFPNSATIFSSPTAVSRPRSSTARAFRFAISRPSSVP